MVAFWTRHYMVAIAQAAGRGIALAFANSLVSSEIHKRIMLNMAYQYQDPHPVQTVDDIVRPYKRAITS